MFCIFELKKTFIKITTFLLKNKSNAAISINIFFYYNVTTTTTQFSVHQENIIQINALGQ